MVWSKIGINFLILISVVIVLNEGQEVKIQDVYKNGISDEGNQAFYLEVMNYHNCNILQYTSNGTAHGDSLLALIKLAQNNESCRDAIEAIRKLYRFSHEYETAKVKNLCQELDKFIKNNSPIDDFITKILPDIEASDLYQKTFPKKNSQSVEQDDQTELNACSFVGKVLAECFKRTL